MNMVEHNTLVRHLVVVLGQAGQPVEVLQTHISTVLLAGEQAYKLKKPLVLPFLDFSSLALREHWCREELRLNYRTAPTLYLGVLPVLGTVETPSLGRDGQNHGVEVLDWVVHMRRFPADALLAEQARQGRLTATTVDALADHVAAFHSALLAVNGHTVPGKDVGAWAQESLEEIEAHPDRPGPRLQAVRHTLLGLLDSQAGWRCQRQREGWVREGHGDLHLGNVVVWQGEVRAFDAIEFDAGLRCIDVMNDVAFAFMDLLAHGLPVFAWRFINRYVEVTGDYDGLLGLRGFAAYRALVRAKVALLSTQEGAMERYWQTAETLLAEGPPARLVLTMGLSGSGKSTAAQMLLEAWAQQGVGAVRVRSDVERKRLFGLEARERPTAEQARELYAAQATVQTYERLWQVAQGLLHAGFCVVLDAAFLRQEEREVMRGLAQQQGADFALVECVADSRSLGTRLDTRRAQGQDASDATRDVVALQTGFAEPVPPSWRPVHWRLHNDGSLDDLQHAVTTLLTQW